LHEEQRKGRQADVRHAVSHVATPLVGKGRASRANTVQKGLKCLHCQLGSHLRPERNPYPLNGHLESLAQEPLVVAVDAARVRAAVGTHGCCGLQLGDDGDALGGGQDLHNGQARRDQGQEVLGQNWLSKKSLRSSYVLIRTRNDTTAREVREIQNAGGTDTEVIKIKFAGSDCGACQPGGLRVAKGRVAA